MILACPTCGASHVVPASRLAELDEVVCRRCDSEIPITSATDSGRHLAPQSDQHALSSDLSADLGSDLSWPEDLPAPRDSWDASEISGSDGEGIEDALDGAEDMDLSSLEPTVSGAKVPEDLRNSIPKISPPPPNLVSPPTDLVAPLGRVPTKRKMLDDAPETTDLQAEAPDPAESPHPPRNGGPIRLKSNARPRPESSEERPSLSAGAAAPPARAPTPVSTVQARARRSAAEIRGAPSGIQRASVDLDPPLPVPSTVGVAPAPERRWMITVLAALVAAGLGAAVASSSPRPKPAPAPEVGQRSAPVPPAAPAPVVPVPTSPEPSPMAYVARNASLHAEIGGRTVARLAPGQEVTRWSAHHGWVLISAGPSGPAGFVEADVLTAEKPVQALAREWGFEGCHPPGGACRASARRQRARCEESCERSPEGALRCRSACRLAYESCIGHCR